MSTYIIHYDEIALKGKNRRFFENILLNNIKEMLRKKDVEKISLSHKRKRLLLEVEEGKSEVVKGVLKRVFGIAFFSRCYVVRGSKDAVFEFVLNHIRASARSTFTSHEKGFRVCVKRVDKSLNFTSVDVEQQLGKLLVKNFGWKVNLKEKEHCIFIELLSGDESLVYFNKVRGPGGLPVGVAGKALCLFSGGIDSPVAAWRMMSRGMHVDFLHIRPMKKLDQDGKIFKLVKVLAEWQPSSTHLFTAQCTEFSKQKSLINPRYASILFRIFVHKLAASIGGYDVLINGDALSQVASQTIHNIFLVDKFVELPIARPLISFSKAEIIDQAKQIGTYELSLLPYKDCCAMLVSRPTTAGKLSRVRQFVEQLGMSEVVFKTKQVLEEYKI